MVLPEQRPPWQESWSRRLPEIAILIAGLLVLTTILVFQDIIVKRRRLYQRLRLAFLVYTLVWLGWIAGAQLSVINVLTFLEALMTEFSLGVLPARAPDLHPLGLRRDRADLLGPRRVLRLALPLRRAAGAGRARRRAACVCRAGACPSACTSACGRSSTSSSSRSSRSSSTTRRWRSRGAEVEPFKTAIVLKFDRAWPFVLYALALADSRPSSSRAPTAATSARSAPRSPCRRGSACSNG